jgi:hypothetical protein
MWRLTGVVWAQAWFKTCSPGRIDSNHRQLCRKSLPGPLFMSASLTGRLRSSAFRLSAAAVSVSLAVSCLSTESA